MMVCWANHEAQLPPQKQETTCRVHITDISDSAIYIERERVSRHYRERASSVSLTLRAARTHPCGTVIAA